MANAVCSLLEDNGIPAMIHSFQIPAYDGLARVTRPVWGEVLVEEGDAVRAKALIDAFLASDSGPSATGTAGQDD